MNYKANMVDQAATIKIKKFQNTVGNVDPNPFDHNYFWIISNVCAKQLL